jgi:hypothetical protein
MNLGDEGVNGVGIVGWVGDLWCGHRNCRVVLFGGCFPIKQPGLL